MLRRRDRSTHAEPRHRRSPRRRHGPRRRRVAPHRLPHCRPWHHPLNYDYPAGREDGAVNVPVDIDNVRITPGDVVVGDEDGTVIVPRDQVAAVIAKAHASMSAEEKKWWARRGQSLGAVQQLANSGYKII